MNDVLNSVMKFINENTYLLIGICVFLILVLIGYLIDNNIKSKKVSTTIKNEAPKEAIKENISESVKEESLTNNEKIDLSSNVVTSLSNNEENNSLEIENLIIDDSIINKQNENITDNTINEELNSKEDAINPFNNFSSDDTLVYNNEITNKTIERNDPDENIMNKNGEVSYSNNKSLFEILSDIDKSKPISDINDKTSSENIFNEKPDIKINTDVKKEEVEIEPKNADEDELDKIMKKLSSMSEEEDNYTNIF